MTYLNELFLQYQVNVQNSCLNRILHLIMVKLIKNSSYYDIDNFNSLVNNSFNHFDIYSANIPISDPI